MMQGQRTEPPRDDVERARQWLLDHALEQPDGDVLVPTSQGAARALAALLATVRAEAAAAEREACAGRTRALVDAVGDVLALDGDSTTEDEAKAMIQLAVATAPFLRRGNPPATDEGSEQTPDKFPQRKCISCGATTTSTSTLDQCVKCGDYDGLRPRHFLTRDKSDNPRPAEDPPPCPRCETEGYKHPSPCVPRPDNDPFAIGDEVHLKARRIGKVVAITEDPSDGQVVVEWGPENGSNTVFRWNRAVDLERRRERAITAATEAPACETCERGEAARYCGPCLRDQVREVEREIAKLRAVAEAAERVRIADEQGGMQAKRSALSALYAALDALPADSSGEGHDHG